MQGESKNVRTKPKRTFSVLLYLVIVVFVSVITVSSIMNYKKANEYKDAAAQSEQKYLEILAENEELEHFLEEENHDEYYEKIAREQYGYARPGERVVYDSSYGN